MLHLHLVKYDVLGHRELRSFMLFARYDSFFDAFCQLRRPFGGGLEGLLAFWGSFWVLRRKLRGALGASRVSLGSPLVVFGRLLGPLGEAKAVFGRHVGSP